MKLNDVMKQTGLTKKAIYYYEDEGFIKPQKEKDGNYRIYTAEDLEKLIAINALRKLDFSIRDIQFALSSEQNFRQALKIQLENVSCEIERLNKSKAVLENFIDLGEGLKVNDLKFLVEQLEDGNKNIAGYMQKELDRILPGNLGKMFAIHYGQFLDEPLNTTEKEKAWLVLITFLDSQDEIQYPDDIKEIVDKMFRKYSENEWLELSEKSKKTTDKIVNRTIEPEGSEKREIEAKIQAYEKTPEYQRFLKFQKFSNENLAVIFQEVEKYVCILSARYEKFNRILHSSAGL